MRTLDELRAMEPRYVRLPSSRIWHKTWFRSDAWTPPGGTERTFCLREIEDRHLWLSVPGPPMWYCHICKRVEMTGGR